MERDAVDLFVEQWNQERPELDPSPLSVVSRVLMLYKFLELSADRALGPFGLSLWQFDVLTALRRSGTPYRLSPSELMRLVTLTSGAMTNRIDRLEELGLVRREEDPDDRRGVLICLTPDGRKLTDRAIVVRIEDARRNIETLTKGEVKTLSDLLRKLVRANYVEPPSWPRAPRRVVHPGPNETVKQRKRRLPLEGAGLGISPGKMKYKKKSG